MKRSKKEKERIRKRSLSIRIVVFFAALLVFAVIGLLIPLRPSESVIEKRALEEFPRFSVSSFLSGDYFDEISIWYADTFPFRERMISANSRVENLYGIRGTQIVLSTETADDTSADNTLADAMTSDETTEDINGTVTVNGLGDNITVQDSEEIEAAAAEGNVGEVMEDEAAVDNVVDIDPEYAGDVYVAGDTAFELFYENYNAADGLAAVVNKAQAGLDGIANVYCLVAPTSISINLSDRIQNKLGNGDEQAYIEYINSQISAPAQAVDAFDLIKSHNGEYIYFRTDHHWTPLGAYYAYTAFCSVKGITPTPIDEYETVEFPDFRGTFYSRSYQAASLGNNPDTIIAYYPKATNNMYCYDTYFGYINWYIVSDVSDYEDGEKYSCFIGGDEPYCEIDNPDINDGSSCLLIKDSYGNAFAPFLVDNYDHVYIIDERYFAECPDYGGSAYNLIVEKGINDVIFLNNTQSVIESRVALLDEMF